MALSLEGEVGRFAKVGNDTPRKLRLTDITSLAVAQIEPPHGERARAGVRFVGGTQVIANGIAPVAAIPTTTATLALWNGESASGPSYLIDRVGYFLGSGTPAAGATLLLAVSSAAVAAPTAATNYSSQSASAGGRSTKARWGAGITFASGSAWFQALSNDQLAAANVGQGSLASELLGGLLIPPGYALGIAILSGAGTTPLYSVSVVWDELQIDLE